MKLIMKRIITLVVLAVAMTMTVQAQGIKFGVKAGLNITKMSISKDVFDSKNKAGFFVGPTLKLSLPMGFGADIAALYDERSANVEFESSSTSYSVLADEHQSSSNETIKQKSIQVPVNLRYNIGLSSMAGIYLAVGPQFLPTTSQQASRVSSRISTISTPTTMPGRFQPPTIFKS